MIILLRVRNTQTRKEIIMGNLKIMLATLSEKTLKQIMKDNKLTIKTLTEAIDNNEANSNEIGTRSVLDITNDYIKEILKERKGNK